MKALPSIFAWLVLTTAVVTQRDAGFADTPAAKPIRHMTFDVTLDGGSSVDTKVSGLDGGPASGTASHAGPPVHEKGMITVDVIAATDDRGLIVDVSQDMEKHEGPVRVGITDHALLMDQHSVISNEERILLHYLARGLMKPGVLAPATTWNDDTNDGSVSDHTTYRVIAVDETAKTASLAIAGMRSVRGPDAYETRTTGQMTYNTGTIVPLTLSLSMRTTISNLSQLTTIETRMTSTLRDDSFNTR